MPPFIPIVLGAIALLALFSKQAKASPSNGSGTSTNVPTTILAPTISPLQASAQQMVEHLKQVQVNAGSVTKAKGREQKPIVSAFQSKAGLTADGKAGPGTLAAAAANGQTILPLVMYWPAKSTIQKVKDYRATLYEIADKLPPQKAQELRSSAERERGQAGVAGGPL